ncbi:YbaN family protein [Neobacillus sp. SAB-20_R2A]|uniref:YbaN family protein n=1 Tax=Neobacillus sp. SAB-20_R2A TaxID=3120519 RepID=UPI003C6E3E1F
MKEKLSLGSRTMISQNRIIKFIFIVIGFISLGLGIIGIVLPVVPTTPLLLLASFCFMKGSERFERWFKGTNLYKRHLESFVRERSMTLRQKLSILLFADAMIAIPFFLHPSYIVKSVLLLIVIYKYYYFIFKIKTVRSD